MNKKVIIPIVVIVIIIAVVAIIFFAINGKKIELNLQELNTSISAITPFNEMATMDVDAEVLSSMYELSTEDYEEAVGKMPLMNVQASMYLIIKAKDGKVDVVKEKVDKYAQNQVAIWSRYLPDQYELVEQRKSGVVGNYVYLIIAETAAEIEGLINK